MKEGALIAGRYQLTTLIGAGGEAQVFRARDGGGEGEVAIRLLGHAQAFPERPQLPEFHPGWVKWLGEGQDADHGAYQVFELLSGQTLSRKLQLGPLDPMDWREFVRQSWDAVEALHRAGWVHGDLHADNFFELEETSSWKLLELPFLRPSVPLERSALFGSIHTLAPEQLNGAPADVAADLFALGCLYYRAAAGEYPHPGTTRQEIAISRLCFAPVPLQEKAPWVSPPWADWVMDLLAKERECRFRPHPRHVDC